MKGHGLLEGKVVVVTAAAGTGIGGAAARRCLDEGTTSGWPRPAPSSPPGTATGFGR